MVELRGVEPQDRPRLEQFFADVPADDRGFFKEDVTDPEIVARWFDDPRSRRVVAIDSDDSILALARLSPGVGRMSHVGDLNLVVAAHARRRGLGQTMARRMLVEAVESGMLKVSIDVAATQTGVIEMFRGLGFEPEALLRDQLRDPSGELHDVVVLSHMVDEVWSEMLSGGIEDGL